MKKSNVINIEDIKRYKEINKKVDAMIQLLINHYEPQEVGEDVFEIGMTSIAAGFQLVFFSTLDLKEEEKNNVITECLRCVDIFKEEIKTWKH